MSGPAIDTRLRARALGLLAIGLVLYALPVQGGPAVKKLTSGLLKGRNASSLVCTIVNESGGILDDVILTIRDEDGDPIAGPTEFDGIGNQETRSVTLAIGSPPVAGYCDVASPVGAQLVGNLRLQASGGKTLTSTPLREDAHGKIQALIDGL